MPPRHDKSHVPMFEGRDEVPPSLREAVSVFVLACAVRVLRGEGPQALFNADSRDALHRCPEEVRRQVDELVKRFRNRMRGFGQAEKDKLMAELRELWESDFVPTSAAVATAMGEAEAEFDLPSGRTSRQCFPKFSKILRTASGLLTARPGTSLTTPSARRPARSSPSAATSSPGADS